MNASKTREGNWVDLSSETGEWYTPEPVLERVRVLFGGQIPLDPATRKDNPTKAKVFFTPEDDGLAKDWSKHDGVFVNPPYGIKNNGRAWVTKIAEEVAKGTPLCHLTSATRFETRYAQKEMLSKHLTAWCFYKGRIHFVDFEGIQRKQNRLPSVFYGYNFDPDLFGEAFRPLGRTFAVRLL